MKMHEDNCHQDDFNSRITHCRTYLKKTDFENGNMNKIPKKKSCITSLRSAKSTPQSFKINSTLTGKL